MTAELKKCITAIFRRKGKELLGEHEFVYAASMDLHWFKPRDAQKLLEVALREGLLKLSSGMLSPTFELVDDGMKPDYRPSDNLIESHSKPEAKDPFTDITGKIATVTKLPKKEIVAKINKAREKMNVEVEVAALLVARGYGIDVLEEIAMVEQRILSKSD